MDDPPVNNSNLLINVVVDRLPHRAATPATKRLVSAPWVKGIVGDNILGLEGVSDFSFFNVRNRKLFISVLTIPINENGFNISVFNYVEWNNSPS